MKQPILLLVVAISFVTLVSFEIKTDQSSNIENIVLSDYCDGWEDGYCEGYKDVKGQNALCPLTPLCPLEKLECTGTYKCGYNRGFKAGRKKAKGN